MANDNLPQPESFQQLVGDMLSAYIQKTGVNDINVGSLTTSLFEAVALTVARASGNVFQIERDLSEDRAVGQALQNIALSLNLIPIGASSSTGTVNIFDTAFTKVATKIYAGTAGPNSGSTTINVSDGSPFLTALSNPSPQYIYIGRGTQNIEGPIQFNAVTQVGSFWRITLVTPTSNFHNINESVILAQGGLRTINQGTTVTAPSTGASPAVTFTTTQVAYILDGETQVNSVPVVCQQTGTVGNVPIGAITEITTTFPTAGVENIVPFTNGQDTESDDQLRIRIKRARLSKGLGTALVVQNSVIGAQPTDENVTCTSSNLITNQDGDTVLYVDNGSGYEEKSSGVGIETIVASAIGGETNFQLQTGGDQTSVAKAYIQSTLSAPFDVVGTDRIAFDVGGVVTEHVFQNSDFASPGGATAYEVAESVNSDANIEFQATTAGGGVFVVFSAKSNTNDSIESVGVTTGRNASTQLGLQAQGVETLRLFKNGLPLSQWGQSATITSESQQSWASIATGTTLIVAVDDTAPITYTFVNQDFIDEGTYPSVSQSNSLASWVNVINAKVTGITAAVQGTQITLTSNLGKTSRASVIIDPSSGLVTSNMFSIGLGLNAQGISSDYAFDRNTAQIRLSTALSAGDNLTAGNANTQAFLTSSTIGSSITISGSDAYFWAIVDDPNASVINTAVVGGSTITIGKPSPNLITFQSSVSGAFGGTQVGDYVIVWSPEILALTTSPFLSSSFEARIRSISTTTLPNDTITFSVSASEYASFSTGVVSFVKGFSVCRTTKTPQKFKVSTGAGVSLYTIATNLNAQGLAVLFSVQNNNKLKLSTITLGSSGALLVVTANSSAGPLGLPIGTLATSSQSLLGFYESGYSEGSFPSFFHSSFSASTLADPPNSFMTSFSTTTLPSVDPDKSVQVLQPFGVADVLEPNELSFVSTISGPSTVNIANPVAQPPYYLYRRLRAGDRYSLSEPLRFTPFDTMSVVLDDNIQSELYEVNLYRTATTYLPIVTSSSFNAYDTDGGSTTPFSGAGGFFTGFDFSNFAVLMKAKNLLMPLTQGSQSAVLFRSNQWGRGGEKITIGYVYPSAPSIQYATTTAHTISIGQTVDIRIQLQSDVAIPANVQANTQWAVTTAPKVAGVSDYVTYTYTGTGTAPTLGSLVGGEYVNISSLTNFSSANQGSYRLSTDVGFTPTATSFTIVRAFGSAVAETVTTGVNNGVSFCGAFPTTASNIVSYINANISSLISASLPNDGGTSGSGVISKSTAESSEFSFSSVSLVDGINWILRSPLSTSPQFFLKNPMTLPTYGVVPYVYNFANGETMKIVPTTLDQAHRFMDNLAVTGLSSAGNLALSSRNSKLQIATETIGSGGAVQIVGGTANAHSAPVLSDASLFYTNSFQSQGSIPISSANIGGFISDQWVKISATDSQAKILNLGTSTNAEVTNFTYNDAFSPTPIVCSRVSLTDTSPTTNITKRYFGKQRNQVRCLNRTFKVENQGKFTCISWDGSGTSPFLSQTQPINFTASDNLNIFKISSTDIQFIITSGTTNFTSVQIGDTITVSATSGILSANAGTFNVTGVSPDGTTLQVYNPAGVSQLNFGSFTLSPTLDIADGDTFTVGASVLTARTSPTLVNDFAIVTGSPSLTANNLAQKISAVVAGATAVSVANVVNITATAVNSALALAETSTNASVSGPNLIPYNLASNPFVPTAQVSEGDDVIISTPFALENQGKFRVVRRFQNSIYIYNPISIEETVTVSGVLGTNFYQLGDATSGITVTKTNNYMVLTWSGAGTSPTFAKVLSGDEVDLTGTTFNVANRGSFQVISSSATSITLLNPSCVAEVGVTGNLIRFLRPALAFRPYESTNIGDLFSVTSTTALGGNVGSWSVLKVIDQNTILLTTQITQVTPAISLASDFNNVYVAEQYPYVGYKQISYIIVNPSNTAQGIIVTTTSDQFNKINSQSGCVILAEGKLSFPTTINKGLDAYRYNIGLIGECNRIVYGDPRDPVTYPGVSAAGVDIYIQPPLVRRVTLAINIRLNTGVPFNIVQTQIQQNVSALVNSNGIGSSIAISTIVAVTNSVAGVTAVSISSPLYSPSLDLIVVQPQEKTLVLNPVTDILVSLVT